MADRFDILGVGCVAVDDLLYVQTYPAPDSKLRIDRSERQCGGLTMTALVAAAKLGGRCAFAGMLGVDPLSDFVRSTLDRFGVDASGSPVRQDAVPIHSVIVVGEKGQTRNIFYERSAPIGADEELPSAELIESSRVLFVDHVGVAGALRAARIAHNAGIPIISDLEEDDHPSFTDLLALVDHFVVTEQFALRLSGQATAAAAAQVLSEDREVAVVTCGREGVWYAEKGDLRRHPAFSVTAVDTTGCGDVFHGAYALALSRGQELDARIRFACAAAALKATRRGGQEGAPTGAELADFLAGQALQPNAPN